MVIVWVADDGDACVVLRGGPEQSHTSDIDLLHCLRDCDVDARDRLGEGV
jgi:hypothetical protein